MFEARKKLTLGVQLSKKGLKFALILLLLPLLGELKHDGGKPAGHTHAVAHSTREGHGQQETRPAACLRSQTDGC